MVEELPWYLAACAGVCLDSELHRSGNAGLMRRSYHCGRQYCIKY